MFKIFDETKVEAINAMREILGKHGVSDAELDQAFEAALEVVRKQFGV